MTHPLVSQLRQAMAKASDPEKAAQMQAYMKTEQPFYGIQAADRRHIFRRAVKLHPIESREEYEAVIRQLWEGEHREEMYQAIEVAERYKEYRDNKSWPLFSDLVHSASHWDTLDWIAAKLVGPLVMQNRDFEDDLRRWSKSNNMWVRRASLLAHLKHKEQTNKDLLSETILKLSGEEEFFIRKAIGWVLRELAKTEPAWVLEFVDANQDQLSNLSKREALKHLK